MPIYNWADDGWVAAMWAGRGLFPGGVDIDVRVSPVVVRGLMAVITMTLLTAEGHGGAGEKDAHSQGRSAVSGTVVEASTGAPIQGALVALSGSGFKGAAFLTDKLGRFVFERLPGGQYTISAQKLGYFDALLGEAEVPTDPFSLRGGMEGLRRLVLDDGQWYPDAVVRLQRPATIRGRVFNEHQRPVARRSVRVLSIDPTNHQPPILAGASVTDDHGAFSVGRLSKGAYVVAVLAVELDGSPAMSADDGTYPLTYYPGGLNISEATPLMIDFGDDLQGVDIRLSRVEPRRVTGRVIAQTSLPSGLEVALIPAGDPVGATTSQVRRSTVSTHGTFEFESVPSGDYTVAFTEWVGERTPRGHLPGGPMPWLTPRGPVPGTGSGTLPVWGTTTFSVRNDDARDIMLRASPLAVASGKISIVTSSDSPFTMPRSVALLPTGVISKVTRSAQVQPDGSFIIDGLIPGDYLVRISGAIHQVTSELIPIQGPIRITEQTEILPLEITVGPGARIAGVVSPIPPLAEDPLSVIYFPEDQRLWPEAASPSSRSDRLRVRSDGTYESRNPIPPGRYRVIAVSDSIAEQWTSDAFRTAAVVQAARVDISAGDDMRVDVGRSDVVVR